MPIHLALINKYDIIIDKQWQKLQIKGKGSKMVGVEKQICEIEDINWLQFISSYYSTFASVLKVVKPGENPYSARVDEWVCDGREDQDDCSRPQGNDSDAKDWAPLTPALKGN